MNERIGQYQRRRLDERGEARGQAGYYSDGRDLPGFWANSLFVQQGAMVSGRGGNCDFPNERTGQGDHRGNWGPWSMTKLIPAAIVIGLMVSEAVNWTLDTAAMIMRAIGAN